VDPIEYIRAVRRRWVLIASAVAVGLVLAWVTTTVAPVGVGPVTRQYQAQTVILSTGAQTPGAIGNLKTLASLVTIPDIALQVAKDVHYTGPDPAGLGTRIQAFGDSETGLLNIKAISTNPREAKDLANGFAKQLLVFLRTRAEATAAVQTETLTRALNRLKAEIADLDKKIGGAAGGTQDELLSSQRTAKIQAFGFLQSRLQDLSSATGFSAGLVIIQEAVPQFVPTTSFIQPPRSRNSRLMFAGIIGLVLGIALALVIERFDTRIRTKKAAEQTYGLPVLAEIPFIPKRKRRRLSSVVPWRRSREDVPIILPYFPRVSDSFRLLGAGIARTGLTGRAAAGGPWTGRLGSRNGSGAVILVTSAGPSEGKTTVVANLAMTFAQVGKKVLVMSCDFRRPHIHELFGVDNTTGLVEALQSSDRETSVLDGCVKQTPIRDVRLVPSGAHPRNTAALLSSERMRAAVEEARSQADIILIDTAPLLASAEITHLFPLVDAVVVVARAKRTTAEVAERASELLKRLDAPVVGIALNGAMEVPVPSSYYRYYTQPMNESQANGPRGGAPPNGQGRSPAKPEPGRVGDSPL
jgi:capsular exopolysaccharide synthesis family protein